MRLGKSSSPLDELDANFTKWTGSEVISVRTAMLLSIPAVMMRYEDPEPSPPTLVSAIEAQPRRAFGCAFTTRDGGLLSRASPMIS